MLTVSYGHYGQCAARIRPDYICWLQLPTSDSSSKEGLDRTEQNRPRDDLNGMVRFWPNASGPEASQCVRMIWSSCRRMELAHNQFQFPTFKLSCIPPQTARITLCKTSLDLIWLWLTVRFWPNRPRLEAIYLVYKNHQHTSGQCF